MNTLNKMVTKTLLLLGFIISFSQASLASDLEIEKRHLKKIEAEVLKQCRIFGDLKTSRIEISKVKDDQHIKYIYDLEFTMDYYVPHASIISYKVLVQSNLTSGYDHVDQDWGLYSVDSVRCIEL